MADGDVSVALLARSLRLHPLPMPAIEHLAAACARSSAALIATLRFSPQEGVHPVGPDASWLAAGSATNG